MTVVDVAAAADISVTVVVSLLGIHSREWASVATAVYILSHLTERLSKKDRATVENFSWYILPTANPDGYNYTWQDDGKEMYR